MKNRLPLMGSNATFTEAGALFSYAGSGTEYVARTANYVDRILRGTKLADLPIEQITKFELVVNMKTAKAIGHTFPPSFLARADHIIE
jgi:putative ABC transport system substrate-binding protein